MNAHQSLAESIRARIREVPDFPKPGIQFKDLTPVFADGELQRATAHFFAERYRVMKIDAIVGIESRGFVVGAPLAVTLGSGFILVRKPGKLPGRTLTETYALEYGRDGLELSEGALLPGMRVVICDDVLATGGTMAATCSLVRRAGAEIVEAAFLVELGFLNGRQALTDIDCLSLLRY